MTTAEDILSFIECEPDSDTARLVYAEALDYDGYSARAELIRVQIELSQMPYNPSRHSVKSVCHCRMCELRRRETELLTQHAAEFRRGLECRWCEGKGALLGCAGDKHNPTCEDCFGTGDAGGLMTRYRHKLATVIGDPEAFYHDVTFHRGSPRVHCRMEECLLHGEHSGQQAVPAIPSDWLLSVVRHHRGVEVWAADRIPVGPLEWKGKRVWSWDRREQLRRNEDLPPCIFDKLTNGIAARFANALPVVMAYGSVEAAQVALARAIPAWARGRLVGTAV